MQKINEIQNKAKIGQEDPDQGKFRPACWSQYLRIVENRKKIMEEIMKRDQPKDRLLGHIG